MVFINEALESSRIPDERLLSKYIHDEFSALANFTHNPRAKDDIAFHASRCVMLEALYDADTSLRKQQPDVKRIIKSIATYYLPVKAELLELCSDSWVVA